MFLKFLKEHRLNSSFESLTSIETSTWCLGFIWTRFDFWNIVSKSMDVNETHSAGAGFLLCNQGC